MEYNFLKCPHCFEFPFGIIEQCTIGHNCCVFCRKKSMVCPICQSTYIGTRNFVIENVIREMRSYKIISPSDARWIKRGVSPQALQLSFPCKFTNCTESLPIGDMLNHIRSSHRDFLIESTSQDGSAYTLIIDVLWVRGKRVVHCIQVSDMGIFYLFVDNTATDGKLRAWMQMVASHKAAKTFMYELRFKKIGSGVQSSFIDTVQSIRVSDRKYIERESYNSYDPKASVVEPGSILFDWQLETPRSRLYIAISYKELYSYLLPASTSSIYFNPNDIILKRRWDFNLSNKDNVLINP